MADQLRIRLIVPHVSLQDGAVIGEEDAILRRVGAKYAATRVDRKVSATALARDAELDPKTIRAFEAGGTWPRDTTRRKFEDALDLPIGTLDRWRDLAARGLPLSDNEEGATDVQQDAVVHAPTARADIHSNFPNATAADLILAGRVRMAAERLQELPPEDIAQVQSLIDALGRARFSDWDSRFDQAVYDLAWPKGVKLGPAEDIEPEIVDAVRKRRGNES